jgi:predicted kinase
MTKPFVLIVTGPPSSGKTTLGRRIADDMRLPFIYKDGIKELLFDTLGWSDRAWSKRLGAATYEILFHIAEAQLRAGASFVLESNFHPTYHNEKFATLQKTYGFAAFQVRCVADGDVLFARFKARAESGERHPGHVDDLNDDEFEGLLRRGRDDALAIEGETYDMDMTDFDAMDFDGLMAAIRAYQARIVSGI